MVLRQDCLIAGDLIISRLKYSQCGKVSLDQSLNAPAFSPCSGPIGPEPQKAIARARLVQQCVTLCREGGKRETQHRPYSCHARRQPCTSNVNPQRLVGARLWTAL